MASSFSRSIAYRQSSKRHKRAARENPNIRSEDFHQRIKDLKQDRRQVRKVMWEWLDPKSRESVDDTFRDAVTNICKAAWYFEEVLNLQSDRTLKAVSDAETNHDMEMKQIKKEMKSLENELRRTKERANKQQQLEEELENAQSDNKRLSDHCKGYRKQIENLQQQINKLEDGKTRNQSVLSEKIQMLEANIKEKDENIARYIPVALSSEEQQRLLEEQQRLLEEQQRLSTEKNKLIQQLNENDEKLSRSALRLSSAEEENRRLKAELKNRDDAFLELKRKSDSFHKSLSEKQEEIKNLKNQLDERDGTLAFHLQEKEKADHQIQRQNEELQQLYTEKSTLQKEVRNKSSEISGYKKGVLKFREEEENMRSIIDRLQQHLTAEKHAKEDALTRLSAAAANKLRDNNPSITDLSDPNRPMKLAEKLSELYDNEWTNAMENMEDHGIEEEEGIQILLNILSTVFTLCKDGGNKVMSVIENFIAIPAIDGLDLSQIKIDSLPKLQVEMLKPLKDFRKSYGEQVIASIKETFVGKLKETIDGKKEDVMEDCKEYIDKAIEYCWMMRIQDPPVHIEWDYPRGIDFDTNKFRSYTKGGTYVSYVVWPVLYLHENGPLLAKGVVQGTKTK